MAGKGNYDLSIEKLMYFILSRPVWTTYEHRDPGESLDKMITRSIFTGQLHN